MSTFKEQFLKLYQKTEPEKRFRAELDEYSKNGQDERLPYHNGIHVRGVLRVVTTMRKIAGRSSSGVAAKSADIAAVFHDLNHSGGPDISRDAQGKDNIDRAIEGLLANPIVNRYPENYIESAIAMIEATRFPHSPIRFPVSATMDDVQAVFELRDADCLWGLLPQFTRHVLWSLSMENSGHPLSDESEVDWDAAVDRQVSFLENYSPGSIIGRSFKNAFLADAIAATREAGDVLKQQRETRIETGLEYDHNHLRDLAVMLASQRPRSKR